MRPPRFIVDNLASCSKARNFSNSSIEASGDYATEAIRNFWKLDPVAISHNANGGYPVQLTLSGGVQGGVRWWGAQACAQLTGLFNTFESLRLRQPGLLRDTSQERTTLHSPR